MAAGQSAASLTRVTHKIKNNAEETEQAVAQTCSVNAIVIRAQHPVTEEEKLCGRKIKSDTDAFKHVFSEMEIVST